MAQRAENRSIDDALEIVKDNSFEGLADAVTVLMNAAMVVERSEYLGAAPYERSATRAGEVPRGLSRAEPLQTAHGVCVRRIRPQSDARAAKCAG